MFRDDYKHVITEYEKFWERKNTKRPILKFSYTKNPNLPPRPRHTSLEQKYLDENYILDNYEHMLKRDGYIAEGYPHMYTRLGPGCLSSCLGGEYALAENTVWHDRKQLITDWENPPECRFDENSELWQHVIRLQHAYGKREHVQFGMPDLGGVLDIVASLRRTEDLLYDLFDYPEEVKEFSAKVVKEWDKAFRCQIEILKKYNQPFDSWMGILSEKPWYPLQCDFCYMLSPDNFDDFVYDDLVAQVNSMERSIYHLDGIGELTHVDKILEIENLTGIQWTCGDGHEPLWNEKWFDLYHKIQDKKKNLVLLGGINENDMESAERLIKSLDPTGLHISAHFSSKAKAEEAVEKITKWCE